MNEMGEKGGEAEGQGEEGTVNSVCAITLPWKPKNVILPAQAKQELQLNIAGTCVWLLSSDYLQPCLTQRSQKN